MSLKILDLGCGNKKREGAIGVDFNDRTAADVVHNLNSFPYPFEDSYFDEVYIDNCLEHLAEPIRVMEEVYRISKKNARIKVIVPYFRSLWAFIDPTHLHFFTVDSFAYYDPDSYLENRWFQKIMISIANRWPRRYEYYLSHLFPLDDITYYLKRI